MNTSYPEIGDVYPTCLIAELDIVSKCVNNIRKDDDEIIILTDTEAVDAITN